jgi:hypothetical protein
VAPACNPGYSGGSRFKAGLGEIVLIPKNTVQKSSLNSRHPRSSETQSAGCGWFSPRSHRRGGDRGSGALPHTGTPKLGRTPKFKQQTTVSTGVATPLPSQKPPAGPGVVGHGCSSSLCGCGGRRIEVGGWPGTNLKTLSEKTTRPKGQGRGLASTRP